MATVLWRNHRDDGLDRCSFQAGPNGFRLSGTALFVRDGLPFEARYTVMADAGWRTRSAGGLAAAAAWAAMVMAATYGAAWAIDKHADRVVRR